MLLQAFSKALTIRSITFLDKASSISVNSRCLYSLNPKPPSIRSTIQDRTSKLTPKSICPGSGFNSKIPIVIGDGIERINSS